MANEEENGAAVEDVASIARTATSGDKNRPPSGPTYVRLDDGEDYDIRFDLNALSYIGDALGIELRLEELGEDLLGTPIPLSALRTLAYASLMHHDGMTEERAGALVTHENLRDFAEAFFGLFGVSLADLSRLQVPGGADADASDRVEGAANSR